MFQSKRTSTPFPPVLSGDKDKPSTINPTNNKKTILFKHTYTKTKMKLALTLVLLLLCIFYLTSLVSLTSAARSKSKSRSRALTASASAASTDLRVGSFNIQVFGVKKMEDPAVVTVLVNTLSRYDICLVQEIRDSTGESIHKLVAKLNEKTGKKYQVALSERLGRTNSKEAYGFIYDPSLVVVERTYQYPSSLDQFERAPFSILISSKANPSRKWFFTGVHISPGKAPAEINKLYDVYEYYAKDSNLKSIMASSWLLMGDFNADCSYMRKSDWVNNIFAMKSNQFKYLIHTGQGTTVSGSNCAYDRFVTTKLSLQPSDAKVFKFDAAFQLAPEFAKKVSDHFPIELTISGW